MELKPALSGADLSLPPGLPNPHEIFPDATGIALALCEEYGLKPDPERRIRASLKALCEHDRIELDKGPSGEPSIPGIKGCVIDGLYVARDERHQLTQWEGQDISVAIVIGPAAAGKTNLLVNHFLGRDREGRRPVLLYSLANYRPQERSLFADLAAFLTRITREESEPVNEDVLRGLVATGAVVLVLDGLDEIARTQGEPIVHALEAEISRLTRPKHTPKIVIACRDHVFKRLRDGNHFPQSGEYTKISLSPLKPERIREKIERHWASTHVDPVAMAEDALKVMAGVPLFYGAVLRDLDLAVTELLPKQTEVEFWRAWMNLSARSCGFRSEHDALVRLGEVAAAMLARRSDYLEGKALLERFPIVKDSAASPWPVFVRESKDKWRFIHQAFREYVLAYGIKIGLESPTDESILTKESSFDYESNETYQHVRDLLTKRSVATVIEGVERHWDQISNEVHWNNLIRNYFETVGMLGMFGVPDKSVDLAISHAKRVLEYPLYGDGHRALFRTKFDAARCLCRLHPTSPPDYCEHAKRNDWENNEQGRLLVCGYAVRGFHKQVRQVNCWPAEAFYNPPFSHTRQAEMSRCLLGVIENLAQVPELHCDGYFLQVNASHALIRWLSIVTDVVDRTRALLARRDLSREVRANLVLALHTYGDRGDDIQSVVRHAKYPNSWEVDLDKLR